MRQVRVWSESFRTVLSVLIGTRSGKLPATITTPALMSTTCLCQCPHSQKVEESFHDTTDTRKIRQVIRRIPDYRTAPLRRILSSCTSVWWGGCDTADWKPVRMVVRTAEGTAGTPLPCIQRLRPSCSSPAGPLLSSPLTPTTICSPCWPLEGGCAAFGVGPTGSVTAASPKPSD